MKPDSNTFINHAPRMMNAKVRSKVALSGSNMRLEYLLKKSGVIKSHVQLTPKATAKPKDEDFDVQGFQ